MDISRKTNPNELRDELMQPGMAMQLKREYQNLTEDYELREHHSLLGLDEKRAHITRMTSFSRSIVDKIKDRELSLRLESAQKGLEKNEDIMMFKKPAALALGVIAVYRGEPIRFSPSQNTRVSVKTVISERRGEVTLSSPWIAGAMQIDPDEKYIATASRGIPFINVQTSVGYKGQSRLMTASVSKQLTASVSCGVDSSRRMQALAPVSGTGEDVIRMNYGINF